MSEREEKSQLGVPSRGWSREDEQRPQDSVLAPFRGSRDDGGMCDRDASAMEHSTFTPERTSFKSSSNTSCAVNAAPSQKYRESRITEKGIKNGELLQGTASKNLHLEGKHPIRPDNPAPTPVSLPIEADQTTKDAQPTEILPSLISSSEQVRAFAKRSHALQDLRDNVLQCRTLLRFEESKEEQNERFTRESLAELMTAVREASSSHMWAAEHEKIARLSDCWLSDADASNKQRNITKEVRDRLSNLEFTLKSCEDEFGTMVQSIGSALGISDEAVRLISRDASIAEESASDTPSLLAELYDRKGDVGIYFERLVELEYQYSEDTIQRNFLADQGQAPFETDEEFDAEYIRRKEETSSRLRSAEMDVRRLEERCRQAGYDFELDAHGSDAEESDLSASADPVMSVDVRDKLPHESHEVPDHSIFDGWPFLPGAAHGAQGSGASHATEYPTIGRWLEDISAESFVHEDICQQI